MPSVDDNCIHSMATPWQQRRRRQNTCQMYGKLDEIALLFAVSINASQDEVDKKFGLFTRKTMEKILKKWWVYDDRENKMVPNLWFIWVDYFSKWQHWFHPVFYCFNLRTEPRKLNFAEWLKCDKFQTIIESIFDVNFVSKQYTMTGQNNERYCFVCISFLFLFNWIKLN